MPTILGKESSPSLRHRPRQRTLEGLFETLSQAIGSPAQPMHVHSNLEDDSQFNSRTIVLKDINAIQAFDNLVCSRIVINFQEAKEITNCRAAVNILYKLGYTDGMLQATSGYSLKRYNRDHQAAFFLQKHPLWIAPMLVEGEEFYARNPAAFTQEQQHLDRKFEDQFRVVESSDIEFIRRVAGQIAIEGH